jgi:type 1 glutamine amidotransferase
VFYTALGHREDIWSTDPLFKAHVVGGIRWALGLEN